MTDVRSTSGGARIDAALVYDFIHSALAHDAIEEPVHELLFAYVTKEGRDPSGVARSLRPMIIEVLDVATDEDWRTIGDQLIANARDALTEARATPAEEAP